MKNLRWSFLVLVLTLPVIWNLLKPGFFLSDDGEWMIIRFSAFHQELVKGQFPVRFLQRLNNGYGYPVATFLYPGFLYFAEIPKILGFGFVGSVKAVFVISVFLAAFFSFLWLRGIFEAEAAFLGSLVYIYSPYFLWDIYKRGSVGEVFALGIVPFILWAMERKSLALTAIGYGLLTMAHNSLAFIFLPLFFLYQCINLLIQRKITFAKAIFSSLSPLVLGLGLSAFFWLPAIFELKYTVFKQVTVSNWQDYFLEIKNLPLLGWFNLIIAALAIFFLLKKRFIHQAIASLISTFFILGVFLTLPLSKFLWRSFPLGRFIQFPFRFLSWEVLASSYLAAFVIANFRKKWQTKVVVMAALGVMVASLSFSKPEGFINKPDSYYATNEATTTVADEYMPVWVKVKPEGHSQQRIEKINKKTVQINTIYWPGWKVYVNGQEKKIDYSNKKGLIRVKVKEKEDQVKAVFTETPLRLLTDFISLGNLVLILYLFPSKRKTLFQHNNRILL